MRATSLVLIGVSQIHVVLNILINRNYSYCNTMYKWINKRFCLSVCLSITRADGLEDSQFRVDTFTPESSVTRHRELRWLGHVRRMLSQAFKHDPKEQWKRGVQFHRGQRSGQYGLCVYVNKPVIGNCNWDPGTST